MQFTPQQLTGGPKYHHKTRIGNWSEERLLKTLSHVILSSSNGIARSISLSIEFLIE